MEAKLLLQHRLPILSPLPVVHRKLNRKKHHPSMKVLAVLTTRPKVVTESITTTTTPPVYNDNWFDRIAINHISQSLQLVSGIRNEKMGYSGFVEAAAAVSRHFNTNTQQELVIQSLNKAFPKPIMAFIRAMLPQTKFTREFFAIFTTVFFVWLVGPCEVKESEVEGRMEKNTVHVKKCRFLEESNCVGMCLNLCKMPSQMFIKDSLGMPFTMVPNFDDTSCDMIFGQEPPLAADDPAFKQPCKILCTAKQKHSSDCFSQ